MKLIDCKCTNCAGTLQVDEENYKLFTCPYCHSNFVVEEAKNYYFQNNNYIVMADKLKLASEVEDFNIVGGELVRYTGTAVNVCIPDGVKIIRANAFANLRAIESVILPLSLVEIGEYAFYNCESLKIVKVQYTDLTFPPRLQTIGKSAFENCKKLRKITLPLLVEELDERVFANCESLFEVDCMETIHGLLFNPKRIRKSAFEGCTGLIRITLIQSVFIEERAFYNCHELRTANIRAKSIKPYAFYNCQKLSDFDFTLYGEERSRIGDHAFENCFSLQELKLNGGPLIIGKGAFKNCKGIKRIEILYKCYVEEEAFSGCESLTNLELANIWSSRAEARSFAGTPIEAVFQERRKKKLCVYCGSPTKPYINGYLKTCRKCKSCNEDKVVGQPYGSHMVFSSIAEETEQYRKKHKLCIYCGGYIVFGECNCDNPFSRNP